MQDTVVAGRDNPYATPASPLADTAGNLAGLELAGRGQRLAAAIIDTVFSLLLWVPVVIGAVLSDFHTDNVAPVLAGLGLSVLLSIGLIVWNCVLLSRNGQTVAKLLLGIKVVCRDGSPASLSRIFLRRYLPAVAISALVGPIFSLVDALMIFGEERRCLHDHFADTIVVTA